MKPTLLHKVLLLVSVPLCFEVTILGVLINLQNQAEVEAQKVNRNKQINDSVNHILIYGISLARIRNSYDLSAFNDQKFKNNMKGLIRSFNILDKQTAYDPSLHNSVLEIRRSMFMAFEDLESVKKKLETATPAQRLFFISASRRDLDQDVDQAKSAGLQELAERSLKGTDETRGRRLRERARILLKYALGLSILTAMFGVAMFSRHLARRLRQLEANTARLAKGEPLLPRQEGTDELAELDKGFHYAADLIARATRMRQEVTAMITQDLKTPLQSITDFFDLLRQNRLGSVDEQGSALLGLSEKEAKRMLSLIDNVLELEKLRLGSVSLRYAPINIVQFLNKSVDAVKILAKEKNIDIARDYAALNDDTIEGDALWLEQVIVNILSNAIKFSPMKSPVTVSVLTTAQEIAISIADKGAGIPSDELAQVFARFHRVSATSNNIVGSGLGLTISKELVELHGGTITVESTLGSGSTFTVKLPRARHASRASSTPHKRAGLATGGRG